MSKLFIVFSVLIVLWGPLANSGLHADSIASEDDLTEAVSQGGISRSQFDLLLALIDAGAFIGRDYLYDNLDRIDFLIDSIGNKLSESRYESAEGSGISVRRITSRIEYRYGTELKESGRSRYGIDTNTRLNEQIAAGATIRREFSGNERWVRRYVAFENSLPFARRITIGNFSKRFGNGLLVGYRGRLTERSEELDAESFVYPDYGGFNGISGEGTVGAVSVQALYSRDRDSAFIREVYAFSVAPANRVVSSSLNIAWNRLSNREGGSVGDLKVSLYGQSTFSKGHVSFEVADQSGERNSSAMIADGVVKGRRIGAAVTIWHYGNQFLDLSTGSRSAALSRKWAFEDIGYELTTRRSGQTGGVINTHLKVIGDLTADNSLLAASINRDSSLIEELFGFRKKIASAVTASIDYFHRTRSTANSSGYSLNRTRLTILHESGAIKWRTYLAASDGNDRNLFLSWFASIAYHPRSGESYELWSNFGKFNTLTRQLDYFYGYFTNRQALPLSINMETKIAHRYSRSLSNKHLSTVSLRLIRTI